FQVYPSLFLLFVFFLMLRPPPRSTLFPYTTLFRSSPYAHARIVSIDAEPAKAAPGVLAVLTGADLKRRGLGTLRPAVPRRKKSGAPAYVCPQPLLAQDRVRYVGDPVAFIVAETLSQAKDATELIQFEYEPLPAVVSAEAALAAGAPSVWDDNPGHEAFTHAAGNKVA